MFKIVAGEDKKIPIHLQFEDGKVKNLVNVTELKAVFTKTDGSKLIKMKTEGAITIEDDIPVNGNIIVNLGDVDTSSLKINTKASFEIEIHEGTDLTIVQFIEQLEIVKRV